MTENYLFTFLRHGESVGNRDHLVQGQYDFPLSPTGIEQARALADHWQAENREISTIITSPLSRALGTAEIIQEALNCPLQTDPLWAERHRGIIEGTSWEEAKRQINFDELNPLYRKDPDLGESDWQLSMRSGRAIQSLFSHPPGKYLIVSHGAILNKVLHNIFGIKTVNFHEGLYFSLRNTAYTEIEYNTERDQWIMFNYDQPEENLVDRVLPPEFYRFTFIRHAQSEGNVRREFQGQTDTSLSTGGEAQINEIGALLQENGYRFDQIIASPQKRAALTAERIATAYQLKLEFDPRLMEVDNGLLAGTTQEEGEEKVAIRHDQHNPYYPVGETGESWFELYLRAGELLDDLLKRPPGEIALVSHGALLNSLLRAIMGIIPQPAKHPGLFYFKNTGFAELTFSPTDNLWQFLALRAPNHGGEMR